MEQFITLCWCGEKRLRSAIDRWKDKRKVIVQQRPLLDKMSLSELIINYYTILFNQYKEHNLAKITNWRWLEIANPMIVFHCTL